MNVKFSLSILAADLTRLGEQVKEAESAGADWLHFDVMDGCFVPELTIGPPVVQAVRPITDLPLDVHLMVEQPERHISLFAGAGADIITIHAEACVHLHSAIQQIKTLGLKAGVALNLATPLSALKEILPSVDLVLLLAVNPGFSGVFLSHVADKTARLRRILDEHRLTEVDLGVDGGIKVDTITEIVSAGATTIVSGSAVFNGPESITTNLTALKNQIARA